MRSQHAYSGRPTMLASRATAPCSRTRSEPRPSLRTAASVRMCARFEQLVREAGLPRVSLHTLRHTAASLLLAAGTHTKVVQEHLGHSSYAITADIYSHVTPAQQREAADRLDQALPW